MLSTKDRDAIKDAYQRIQQATPGFTRRRGQAQMIADVANIAAPERAADAPRIALIEGPTGTGKSLGYLLPLIVLAQRAEPKRPIVISTHTIALQQQLVERDIPALAKALGTPIPARILKGRQRYACPLALERATRHDPGQQGLNLGDPEPFAGGLGAVVGTLSTEDRAQLAAMAADWQTGAWDGDLDHRPPLGPDAHRAITATHRTCLGRRCPRVTVCPTLGARQGADESALLVTNHALLMRDLTQTTNRLLPDPADALYVLDEAHHVPDVAIEQSAHLVPLDSAERWAAEAIRALHGIEGLSPEQREASHQDAERIKDRVEDLAGALTWRVLTPSGQPSIAHTYLEPIPEDQAQWAKEIANASADIVRIIEQARRAVQAAAKAGAIANTVAGQQIAVLGRSQERLERVAETAGAWAAPDATEPRVPPVARWVTAEPGAQHPMWTLGTSPISAAGFLRARFFDRATGVVCTSGTLSTMGTFAAFRRACGITAEHPVLERILPSPFDWANRSDLIIPPEADDPRQRTARHRKRQLGGALSKWALPAGAGGTLALFTARASMEDAVAGLPARLRKQVLVQGTESIPELLAKHAAAIRKGRRSMLVGLQSFSEGLDLPGELCRRVIIDRLPFAVPDHPVEQVRAQWLRARNLDYFRLVALPHASLRLKQAVGRLLRRELDYGDIVCLDRRLVSTPYGALLLGALPPMRLGGEQAA